jgi:hypothetical protein
MSGVALTVVPCLSRPRGTKPAQRTKSPGRHGTTDSPTAYTLRSDRIGGRVGRCPEAVDLRRARPIEGPPVPRQHSRRLVVCREDLSPTEREVRDGALDDPVARLRRHPTTNGSIETEPSSSRKATSSLSSCRAQMAAQGLVVVGPLHGLNQAGLPAKRRHGWHSPSSL